MTQRTLSKLAQSVLGSSLLRLGFQYEDGAFFRELPTKVIHLVLIALDARSKSTFQVLCGLASKLITEGKMRDMGIVGGGHLTRTGWSHNSGRWQCANETSAIDSFNEIKSLLERVVEPWFQARVSLSSMAAEMKSESHGLLKAKLYAEDANVVHAVEALKVYQTRLERPKRWDDPKEIEARKRAVQRMLEELTGR